MTHKFKLNSSNTHKIIIIFLLSLIYSVAFYFCYNLIKHGIVSYLSLIPALLISWKWGSKAGFLITTLNIIIWTNIIVSIVTPNYSLFQVNSILGTIMHFSFCLIVGTFSSLTRKLRFEISERKSAEQQLKQYQNHLEKMVKDRTEELQSANEQLWEIKKMEAIGRLAGGIAHNFNNQLTIILGYTDILSKKYKDDPKWFKYLQQIHSSGKIASDLTKQLLAFARKGIYKIQTVNLNDISKETELLLSRGINKNIKIVTKFEAVNPYIWGGATQLQTAILNLALNACDTMNDGGTLTIKTANFAIDQKFCNTHALKINCGETVSVTIQDTGIGMDEETKNHLFEPFFTSNLKGTSGIGLATVYGIVKSHNGGIIVKSHPQSGSSFSLLFPCTSIVTTNTKTKMKPSFINNNLNILIVDDERNVAEAIKEMLDDPKITVNIAYSGKEAIDLYRFCWQKIDLVLLDMVMPGIDGFQTFAALKEVNPKIKAIISSGYTMNKKITSTLQEGAIGFLLKPYTKDKLIDKILDIYNNDTKSMKK